MERLNKILRYASLASLVVTMMLVAIYVYKYLWEFNNKMIQNYIIREAQNFSDAGLAAATINDSVKSILDDDNKVRRLKRFVSESGMSKEEAIVKEAVLNCYHYKYLTPPMIVKNL